MSIEGVLMNEISLGRCQHYKGNEYTVLGTARHSETLEKLVVFRQEYGEHGLWVRPKQMFSETVKVDGRDVPRFQPLGSSREQVGEGIKNIFDDLPQRLPKELVQILVRAADVRIERIISYGHASPADFWYDQPQHERVIVLKGAAMSNVFTPGPTPNTVRAANGTVKTVPDGWMLLPPGDAALTRRVKAAGDHWIVQEKKGRKVFSRGVWAPAATIKRIRAERR